MPGAHEGCTMARKRRRDDDDEPRGLSRWLSTREIIVLVILVLIAGAFVLNGIIKHNRDLEQNRKNQRILEQIRNEP